MRPTSKSVALWYHALGLGLALSLGCSGDEPGGSGPRAPQAPDMFGNAAGSSAAGAGSAIGGPAGASAARPLAGTAAPGPGEACASGVANTSPITPTVWLVLDGSGSMDEDFENGSSRWDTLRSALMDDGGLVQQLEQTVRFGMVLYSGIDEEEQTAPDQCVQLEVVDPALNNYATIDARFPQEELGGWTPTDRALEHVVTNLPVVNEQVLDAMPDPIYVILATDGAPNDRCGGDGGGRQGGGSGLDPEVAERVLTAVDNGVRMGMRMFIISLAGGDDELQQHLEEVAMRSGTDTPPFVPSTREDLITTFRELIGAATCQFALEGEVEAGSECTGKVTLNGAPLACNSDDGWRLTDPKTVQLTGSACDTFLGATSRVVAEFPCGAYTVD